MEQGYAINMSCLLSDEPKSCMLPHILQLSVLSVHRAKVW